MSTKLPFRISSALKSIIGKELITDEFVAVYELVKNSFDAYAGKVSISFENLNAPSQSKIIIRDDGKGMSLDDINSKWLFVAYSAKKAGIENDDYRNKINSNRVLAGAKGVGRFSCDRLGRHLNLITRKDARNSSTEQILVNWEEFEIDPLKEFVKVKVEHNKISKSNYNLAHGTILEITGLRDTWDRDRILKLKRALVKLINPNQNNDSRNFEIELIAKDELANDKKVSEPWERVNGKIENNLFENLKIKTTNITVEISTNGNTITTTLEDRGDFIYKLTEKNPFRSSIDNKPILSNIKVYLFQLNQNAKTAFHKMMGIRSVDYGAVFLYKNGFRIYPFGEPGEDILLIDRRKAQGYNRFLGNRDLIGRIEIYGDNNELRETSSRDGGLVKTETYYKLVDFFYDYVLKRIENYAVNVIKWGDEFEDKISGNKQPELWAKDVKIQILELISGFIKSENIINIEYDKNFLNIIESKQDKSVDKIIKNISHIGAKSNNPAIVKEAAKIGKVVKEVKEENRQLSNRNAALVQDKSEISEQLEYIVGQNQFLADSVKSDTKEFKSLLHHTEKATYWINKYVAQAIKAIESNAPKDKIKEILSDISLENQKIFSFTKYHKSTKFNTFVDKINQDIVEFINEYINNVCKHYKEYENINIHINATANLSLVRSFAPITLAIIFDNLLDNSRKAKAKNIFFEWSKLSNKEVVLKVRDDGIGISKTIINNIFDFHFSTTKGSGLGLFHVKKVISDMNGVIVANSNISNGAEFIITFRK